MRMRRWRQLRTAATRDRLPWIVSVCGGWMPLVCSSRGMVHVGSSKLVQFGLRCKRRGDALVCLPMLFGENTMRL